MQTPPLFVAITTRELEPPPAGQQVGLAQNKIGNQNQKKEKENPKKKPKLKLNLGNRFGGNGGGVVGPLVFALTRVSTVLIPCNALNRSVNGYTELVGMCRAHFGIFYKVS